MFLPPGRLRRPPSPSELGLARVRHFKVAQVGYIRLGLGEGLSWRQLRRSKSLRRGRSRHQARAKPGITSRANSATELLASARLIMPKLTCSEAESKPPTSRS